jgi:intracellular sulfur oxidation DsrE/DsrF family protein
MQHRIRHILPGFYFGLFLIGICLTSLASASGDEDHINRILKRDSAPFGVVFEVVEGDHEALEWAIPRIKQYASQLRAKFPDIGIAVVSHGKEEFALMKSNAGKHKEVHKIVQSLVKEEEIPVHVCGTHASWYGKKPEDFPAYIDVAPAGPTQISNYEDMGYELVEMEKQ